MTCERFRVDFPPGLALCYILAGFLRELNNFFSPKGGTQQYKCHITRGVKSRANVLTMQFPRKQLSTVVWQSDAAGLL